MSQKADPAIEYDGQARGDKGIERSDDKDPQGRPLQMMGTSTLPRPPKACIWPIPAPMSSKVERPETGDPFRALNGGLIFAPYQTYNRNKPSTLYTKRPEDLKGSSTRAHSRAPTFSFQNFRAGLR